MTRPARPLRSLLLKQLEGKTLFATANNNRFRSEFCTEGLVLGSSGQILFSGGLSESIEWADQYLDASDVSESDDDHLVTGQNLLNLESTDDGFDDGFG